jgi:hypothetical protein
LSKFKSTVLTIVALTMLYAGLNPELVYVAEKKNFTNAYSVVLRYEFSGEKLTVMHQDFSSGKLINAPFFFSYRCGSFIDSKNWECASPTRLHTLKMTSGTLTGFDYDSFRQYQRALLILDGKMALGFDPFPFFY